MMTLTTPSEAHAFWDRIAPKYARKPITDRAAYEDKLQRVAALLHRTDRVLEIGCGTGSTALRLAAGVAGITATDVSRTMIEIAKTKLGPDAPTNVAFRQAEAQDLIEGRPFDVVCAFSLLHLVDDLPRVLARVHMQLKPGGLFVSKTVCVRDANVLIRALIPTLRALGFAPRVARLGAEDLTRQIEAAGFRVEEVSHLGSNRMNPFVVARRIDT